MAGYRIEFDGSLNERLNVTQSTGNSSLTADAIVQEPVGGGYLYSFGTSHFWANGINGFAGYGIAVYFGGVIADPAGQPSGTTVYTNGIYTYYRGTLQLTTSDFQYYSIRREYVGSGPVTISNLTDTEGVAPTGGIATLASPTTITNGQSGLSNPAKLFGARVVHDMIEVSKAKYLPSADATQDAEASISDTEFFTATDTSVSVEAEGLSGPERLIGGKTSVIIENVANTVEN